MPDPDRPLAARSAFLALYSVALGAFLYRHRDPAARRLPERPATLDLALIAVATSKVSRVIAKEKVTAPIREPFTEHLGDSPVPAEVRERPTRAGRFRRGIGELLVCPYCLDMWVGTAFAAGLVEAPRQTRFLAGALSAVTASDFLQAAYRRANERR